jgi:hypothetical protein
MAVFKTLNSQDVIISPLKVSKNFRFEGASALTASNVGIDRFLGTNGNFLTDKSLTGQVSQEYQVTVYNSAKQLYYTNYLSGSFGEVSNAVVPSFNPDGTITPPSGSSQTYNTLYYNFDETTLNPQKTFPTESIGVVSIPTKLYGDYITPGSFKIISPVSGTLYDDREGRIKLGDNYVGNIIYEHGIVVITDRSALPTTTTTTTSTTTTTTTTTTAAPTSGAYQVNFNIFNETTKSIDIASLQFSFVDVPNNRPSGAAGYYLYITASNIPIGKSTYSTKANFTSSFVNPGRCCMYVSADPDTGSIANRYIFSASLDTGSQALFTTTSGGSQNEWINSLTLDTRLNPLTWTTASYNLTASYTP